MSKEKLNIKWIQIIITGIITGLVSLIVAIIVFNYTNEKVELIYEEFPVSSYQSNSTKVCILNYSVKNTGVKTATNVQFLVQLPEGVIIKEPNIKLSNALTKSDVIQRNINSTIFEIKSLYGNESFNISLLVENMQADVETNIELRCNENIGKLYNESDDSISPTMIYVTLTLVVLFIILFMVLIFTAKKAIKALQFLGKKINEEADLEEQKVRDLITQGVEYCDMGMIDDSIRVLIKGKYLHPESSSIHSNLARAFAKKGEFEKSEAEFRVAEKIMIDESDKLIFHYTKAHYFAIKKDKDNMLKYLELAQGYDVNSVCKKMILDEEFDNYKEDEDFLILNARKTKPNN